VPKTPFLYLILIAGILGPAAGCATVRQEVYVPVNLTGMRGIIFCADGAGDFQRTSEAVSQVVAGMHIPLYVEPFEWSHGPGRVLLDQIDQPHAVAEGRRLACKVLAYRQSYPNGEVYLVGHSAGSAVVLAAAEALPPCTVDRIVLLAPSVSMGYDLRPALRTARDGMDVFFSRCDTLLELAVGLVGTADRYAGPAAGEVGFRPTVCCIPDAALYGKLRQHAWTPCVAWTGNTGGHYGSYEPGFLRAYVIPLFQRCCPPPSVSCVPRRAGV
jgi:hypothetical protein